MMCRVLSLLLLLLATACASQHSPADTAAASPAWPAAAATLDSTGTGLAAPTPRISARAKSGWELPTSTPAPAVLPVPKTADLTPRQKRRWDNAARRNYNRQSKTQAKAVTITSVGIAEALRQDAMEAPAPRKVVLNTAPKKIKNSHNQGLPNPPEHSRSFIEVIGSGLSSTLKTILWVLFVVLLLGWLFNRFLRN